MVGRVNNFSNSTNLVKEGIAYAKKQGEKLRRSGIAKNKVKEVCNLLNYPSQLKEMKDAFKTGNWL